MSSTPGRDSPEVLRQRLEEAKLELQALKDNVITMLINWTPSGVPLQVIVGFSVAFSLHGALRGNPPSLILPKKLK